VRVADLATPLIKKADVVIPLAAYVGAPLCDRDPVGSTTTNKDAVLAMFKTLSRQQLVLMPTTNSAYGTGNKDNHCDETSPLDPISRYAKDKVAVEKALLERENSISFRLATVFGMSPRMRVDLLVNDFTHRAVYDRFVVLFEAHFKRNYIHIRDVARVFQHGLKNFEKMHGQVYNVGLSDANLSKLELCQAIKQHLPNFTFLEAPVGKDPDQRNYIVSNAKLEATGFKPAYRLDDGLRELIKGYRMIKNTKYANV
jgi:nucleoside-diphosphate-sugar epimerase